MSDKIPHWLQKQAELSPNRLAAETPEGRKLTFRQLHEAADNAAGRLVTLGITKGSRVAVLSPNSVDMIVLIHALSYIGATLILLNTRLTISEWTYQLQDSEADLLLAPAAYEQAARETGAAVCTMENLGQQAVSAYTRCTELSLDNVFSIIYTSGTTGNPKGVEHTYGNHWWSAIGSALNLGLSQHDKWLSPLPMFHVGGLSTIFKSAIYGMPLYVTKSFDEQTVQTAIMQHGVTIVSVVTVMLQRLLRLQERDGVTYPETFRCMLLGGGPAPLHLLQEAKTRAIPVFQSYGMTETASQIVTLSPEDSLRKLGSAGKALVPAQLRIKGTFGLAQPEEAGEIQVKGPMITNGYYRNADATASAFQDGWLATGDIGYTDREGYLYVLDRRKDLIISGGENVYPAEVENILSGHPSIQEAAVVGKADARWGMVPAAFLVKQQEVSIEELQAYCEQRLARYKIPKNWHWVEQLPRNASNKLMRYKLQELLKEDSGSCS
ncbi:2-succinylbenzoyl-CoA synthetase [Terribacillus aidingensis]|uniref:2-succinylbenzoate--CoA ligase n=1 Tax=Terribacillus aidingensis TaxID=586416 RepID=A0A285NEB3_9BACI|nr:o-succinylbenzoate--CoA ligase [Terribacillus aidingensis]SNZ05991.1 2-succinylbenzoyl-CoA synthetase [Terribacillus aidingensis]